MSNNEIPMTLAGKKKLDAELEHLIKVERENVKKAIQEAREHGDLRENAEYHAAKEKQSLIEGKIMDLQSKVTRARVVDVSSLSSDKIIFGATVTLLDTTKDVTITYQIVGDEEADIKQGTISYLSPLGKALIGKEEGDIVVVQAPKGPIEYEVESFEFK